VPSDCQWFHERSDIEGDIIWERKSIICWDDDGVREPAAKT
jgi:hypothetical protein